MVEKFSPCEIRLIFGDGERLFRLPLKQIAELQEACGGKTGGGAIGSIYKRLSTGDYTVEDLTHIIRLGLIGGGMAWQEARDLTARELEGRPLMSRWGVALGVLQATMQGYEPEADPDSLKKKDPTGTDGSASAEPTETAPSSETSDRKPSIG